MRTINLNSNLCISTFPAVYTLISRHFRCIHLYGVYMPMQTATDNTLRCSQSSSLPRTLDLIRRCVSQKASYCHNNVSLKVVEKTIGLALTDSCWLQEKRGKTYTYFLKFNLSAPLCFPFSCQKIVPFHLWIDTFVGIVGFNSWATHIPPSLSYSFEAS
jgi:hypothetical protein